LRPPQISFFGILSHFLLLSKQYLMLAVTTLQILCPILTAAEGFVLGVGAKMFTIAGPVIVYGNVASVVYGIIYWITTLF